MCGIERHSLLPWEPQSPFWQGSEGGIPIVDHLKGLLDRHSPFFRDRRFDPFEWEAKATGANDKESELLVKWQVSFRLQKQGVKTCETDKKGVFLNHRNVDGIASVPAFRLNHLGIDVRRLLPDFVIPTEVKDEMTGGVRARSVRGTHSLVLNAGLTMRRCFLHVSP